MMQLPEGTHLAIGSAVVEVIERRNPCLQLNGIDPRLLKAVVKKLPGQLVFKAGMMTRILESGWVRAGDLVEVLSSVEILRCAQDDTHCQDGTLLRTSFLFSWLTRGWGDPSLRSG